MPEQIFLVEEQAYPNSDFTTVEVARSSSLAAKALVSRIHESAKILGVVGLSGMEADMFRLGCVAALANNTHFNADFNSLHYRVRKADVLGT